MLFGKSSKRAIKGKIQNIDPMKRMWFFGAVIMIMSIFAEPRLIPAVLLFMLFMSYAQHRSRKRNALAFAEELVEIENELLKEKEIIEEHIESGNATLEEKLLLSEVQEELTDLAEERKNNERLLQQIEDREKKIKNLLVKWKKPSKIITTGKKEKTKEEKEKL